MLIKKYRILKSLILCFLCVLESVWLFFPPRHKNTKLRKVIFHLLSLTFIILFANSNEEPSDISRNRANSFALDLAEPSAILVRIESAALCICETGPKRSVWGNALTSRKISETKAIDLFPISNFLKLCISIFSWFLNLAS